MVKIGRVVPKTWSRTDKHTQTHRQTRSSQYSALPCRGGVTRNHFAPEYAKLKFASFNARSLRNKVDATSDLFTIHGIDITSALFCWSTRLKSHWRLCPCLTPPDWTPAETVWHSSTGWLTRALVMSSTCYGALEIVGLLLLLLFLRHLELLVDIEIFIYSNAKSNNKNRG